VRTSRPSAANPGNVTVFGESAGALSIGTLLRCLEREGCSARRSPRAARRIRDLDRTARRVASSSREARVDATREALAAVQLGSPACGADGARPIWAHAPTQSAGR